MNKSFSDFKHCSVSAVDGVIGHVSDMYFDDQTRCIRYFVVKMSGGLLARLISPISVGTPDWSGNTLPACVTKHQVELSPDIETVKPVSRQYEMRFCEYYKYPFYWEASTRTLAGPQTIPPGTSSSMSERNDPEYWQARAEAERLEVETEKHRPPEDSHLRSLATVMTYDVYARDGRVGHIEDVFIDEQSWRIDSMLIGTTKWAVFGHRTIITADLISDVNWLDRQVTIKLTQSDIRNSPPYEPSS